MRANLLSGQAAAAMAPAAPLGAAGGGNDQLYMLLQEGFITQEEVLHQHGHFPQLTNTISVQCTNATTGRRERWPSPCSCFCSSCWNATGSSSLSGCWSCTRAAASARIHYRGRGWEYRDMFHELKSCLHLALVSRKNTARERNHERPSDDCRERCRNIFRPLSTGT